MDQIIDWLLKSTPYVEYRTRLDLLDQSLGDPDVVQAKRRMLCDPHITALISDLGGWEQETINNHKKAGLYIHKLAFLADLGITVKDDKRLSCVTNEMMAHVARQGIINVQLNIPKAFGGTGQDTWAWSLCDTPSVMFALIRMGVPESDQLIEGLSNLKDTVKDNGWPCVISPTLGKFRGPGKVGDPCPYGTLLMLKAMALLPELKDSAAARKGTECLLDLWTKSYDAHPYLFYMGKDFRKLKAPFVWYDILHVADVLSQYDLCADERLREMVNLIISKANDNGAYIAESQWMAWKGFEFAQKKVPSAWITFLVLRIKKRLKI